MAEALMRPVIMKDGSFLVSPDARINARFDMTDEQAEQDFYCIASQCFDGIHRMMEIPSG